MSVLRESKSSFSLRSFKLSENEEQNSPQSLQSINIEKEEPRYFLSQNQFDDFYQKLSLSFYTPKLGCLDKKMPKSLLDLKSNLERWQCKTESQKFLFPQPTLSNGVSESTVESQNQFNYHSTSNETGYKWSPKNQRSQQEEITFYTPEIDDKMLVLKEPSRIIENKVQASTSFYQGTQKIQPKQTQQQKPSSRSKQKGNMNKIIDNNYFIQKQTFEKERREKQKLNQVINRINIQALKHIMEQDKKQVNTSKNSFYFKRKINTKESSESQNTSNASQKSSRSGLLYHKQKNNITNLLSKSPYQSKETNKKNSLKKLTKNAVNSPSQQNIQQQYLQRQLEEIKQYQAKELMKNQYKADYGLQQINLDKYIRSLIKKQK